MSKSLTELLEQSPPATRADLAARCEEYLLAIKPHVLLEKTAAWEAIGYFANEALNKARLYASMLGDAGAVKATGERSNDQWGWPVDDVYNRLAAVVRAVSEPQLEEVPSLSAWDFSVPGHAIYRGHAFLVSGKPRQVMQTLWHAQLHTMTEDALFKAIWDDPVEGDAVRSAVKRANTAIREGLEGKVELPPYPIGNVDRGSHCTAWRLLLV